MDIFKNITHFNESVEQPVIGEPADLIFAGGCCLFFGALGIMANVVGFAAVITDRKLHTPCFLLISAQLISACLTAFGFLTDGAQFAAAGAKVLRMTRTRLVCFASGVTKTITMAPSAVLTCMVGVDRLISLTWPVHYRKVGRRYALYSLSLSVVIAVANTVAAAATGPSMSALVPCYNSFLALDIYFFMYYTCHNLFFCCTSVGVYAAIVVVVKIRKSANSQIQIGSPTKRSGGATRRSDEMERTGSQSEDVFLRQQLALLPMIGVMMILYLVTGVVPEVATSLSAFIDQGRYQPRVVIYASVLKAIGTSADVFVLLFKCHEFRKNLCRLAYRILRRTVVEPVNESG